MVQTEKTVWSRLLAAVWVYRPVQIQVTQRMLDLGPQKSQWKIQTSLYVIISSNDRQSLHFYGAIAQNGTVHLIKLPEKCNSLEYIHILEKAGVQFFPELGYMLVDGNAPIHRSQAVKEWKTRQGIESVRLPVHSPDLNPIGNVWAFMKTQLRSMKPEFCGSRGRSLRHLEQKWINWNKLEQSELVPNLDDSLPKRIQKCLSNTGFLKNYWYHSCFRFFCYIYCVWINPRWA